MPPSSCTAMAGSPLPHRKKVEEETRLVLEAFLQGTLSNGRAGAPGHVGRGYHDPQSYMCRNCNEHGHHSPGWTSVHEEINRVEEKKHGFRTSIKELFRRRPGSRSPAETLPSSKNSLKRSKAADEAGEDSRQKRSFSFKSLLRKKGATSEEATPELVAPPRRPDSLPLVTSYGENQPAEQQLAEAADAEGTEFYNLVAQKLDHLVKQQHLASPAAAISLPSPTELSNVLPTNALHGTQELECPVPSPLAVNSEELPRELDEKQKEQILQKLIALLEEQAEVFNMKIKADPFLRNTLSRLSYGSFSRLAEAFTSRAPPSVPSPQLAKLALTMELTRKVAGINSHTVHTLMGYSLQYMDMFVPWLQQQGGWENIVAHEEIFDVQLD